MTCTPINSSYKKKKNSSQQILNKQVYARHYINGEKKTDKSKAKGRAYLGKPDMTVFQGGASKTSWSHRCWVKLWKETNVQTSLVYSSPPPWTSHPSHQIRTQESPIFTSTLEAPGLSEMQKSAYLAHSEFNWTDHSLKQFLPILQRMDPTHLLSLWDLSTPQSFRWSWIPLTGNNEVSLLNSLIRTLPSDLYIWPENLLVFSHSHRGRGVPPSQR